MKSIYHTDGEQKIVINDEPRVIEFRRSLIVATTLLVILLIILTRI